MSLRKIAGMTEREERLVKTDSLGGTYSSKIEVRDRLMEVCCQPS